MPPFRHEIFFGNFFKNRHAYRKSVYSPLTKLFLVGKSYMELARMFCAGPSAPSAVAVPVDRDSAIGSHTQQSATASTSQGEPTMPTLDIEYMGRLQPLE